jgi:hypothetical protein
MVDTIDFSQYDIDLVERAETRRLSQFSESCVISGVLTAETNQGVDALQAVLGVLSGRTIAQAAGVQLDIIGRLVGQDRVLVNQDIYPYFTPDATDPDYAQDIAPAWTTNGALAGDLPANDAQYRSLIIAKIFKNHVKFSSIPEVLQFVRLVYGINISIIKQGNADICLVFPAGTPQYIVLTLTGQVSDNNADHQYFIPTPCAGRIDCYIIGTDYFTPDTTNPARTQDIAGAAVYISVT